MVFVVSMSALRSFNISELKAAINGGNIIGEGGSCYVYKVSNMLCVLILSTISSWEFDIYGNLDILSVRLN
jgi:hypothetical protein